jgi:hypothetical protein
MGALSQPLIAWELALPLQDSCLAQPTAKHDKPQTIIARTVARCRRGFASLMSLTISQGAINAHSLPLGLAK